MGDQVPDDYFEELPQRKLPCDKNAEKVTRKVSDPSFMEKLLAPVKDLKTGLSVNAPSISVSCDRINDGSHQSPGAVINSNGSVMNSTFISAPLRLTGGGDASFEYQDDVDVNLPSISMCDKSECQDPFISSPPNHEAYDVSNESVGQIWMEQSVPCVNSVFIYTPLRLTGGGDTSFEYQDDMNASEYQNPSISYPPNHDSHDVSNESVGLTLIEQSEISELPIDNSSGGEPPERIDADDLDPRSIINIDVSIDENDDPKVLLETLKAKNRDRPIVAHININFLSPKFEPLKDIIKDNIDILLVSETKLDDTFPDGQFFIEGYKEPIRLDRNKNGGGLLFFIHDDLESKEIKSHKLPKK